MRALTDTSTGLLRVADRRPAPRLNGETLDGGRLDVSQMRGKIVVVNFWASWCPPCRAESANLVKVANETAALGVQFVGVNIKNDRTAALRFEKVHNVP